jgi:hypothetical protein
MGFRILGEFWGCEEPDIVVSKISGNVFCLDSLRIKICLPQIGLYAMVSNE